MNKQLLLEKYIKVAVRKALKEEEAKQQKATKAMYLIYRFPGLKKVVEELMSPSFGRFIQDVSLYNIVTNVPTTYGFLSGQKFWYRVKSVKNYQLFNGEIITTFNYSDLFQAILNNNGIYNY